MIAPDPDGGGPLVRSAQRTGYDAAGRVIAVSTGTVSDAGDAAWAGFAATRTVTTSWTGGYRERDVLSGGGVSYGVTQYGYDAAGRPECTAQRLNPAAWGALPGACSLGPAGSDGPDRIGRTVYDAAGRVVKTVAAYGTADAADAASASYTDNGQVASLSDGEGNRTGYGYDGHDRLSRTYYPVAAKGANASSAGDYEQLDYDANGNVVSRRLRDGSVIGYGYDGLDRLVVKLVPDGGGLPAAATRDVYYGYELDGPPVYARFDGATGEGVSEVRDALGRVTSATSTMGGVSRTLWYEYDLAGNRTRLTHPDGRWFASGHDAAGRPVSGSWWSPAAGTVPFLTIGYDAQGRRTQVTRGSSASGYGHDAVSRLTSLTQTFAGGAGDALATLTYNAAGQVASRSEANADYAWSGSANASTSYAANGLNQYAGVGSAGLSYDARGNLSWDGTRSYGYDVENRLVWSSGGTSLSYDPLGRLDAVTRAGSTTRFVYDGGRAVAEYDGSGLLVRRHGWDPGLETPVLEDAGGALDCSGTRLLHADERGSIVARADCWGVRTGVNGYDEYGVAAAGNTGRFGYTGQAWLSELGLWYYKARMYSPVLGRFLQTDPIGYADGLNAYAYAGGDPVNNTDPSGLAAGTSICPVVGYSYDYWYYPDKDNKDGPAIPGSVKPVYDCRDVPLGNGVDEVVVYAARSGKAGKTAAGSAQLPQKDDCAARAPSGQCAYIRDDEGKLKLDPEYAKKACQNYKSMMTANRNVGLGNLALSVPGTANAGLGGTVGWLSKTAGVIGGRFMTFTRGVVALTTGLLGAGGAYSAPEGCK